MPFVFQPMRIRDVILIEPKSFEDGRGFFMETYKRSEFAANGIAESFAQDNFSCSKRGVIRGLHYQSPPKAQAKLVSVAEGEIWDVAVDIRRNSPTYCEWVGILLSSENRRMLYVPAGFAHGFSVLSPEARVSYKVSEEYSPEHDRGIRWDDPKIRVDWIVQNPVVSRKDENLPALDDADNDFCCGRDDA